MREIFAEMTLCDEAGSRGRRVVQLLGSIFTVTKFPISIPIALSG